MTYEEYKKKREQEEKERQDSYEQYKAARDAETEVPRIYSMMSDWQSRNNDYYNKYESTKNNASSFSSADQTAWEDYVSTTNRGFMNDAANILSLAEKHKDRLGEDYSKIKDTILVDVDNHSVIKKNAFSTGAQRAASDINARLSALRTGQESFVKKYSDKADKFADGQTYFIGHDEWNEDVQRANVELADDAAGIIKLIDGASERYKDYFDAKGLGELKSMLEEGAESGWQIAGSAKNLNDFYSQWQNGGDFTLSKQAARNEGQGLWTLRAVYDNAKEVADKMDDIATKYADKRKYVGKKEDIVNDWGWTDNMSADDVRAYFERNYKNDDDRNAALDKYKEYTDYKYLQTQLDEITGGRTLGELASLIESEEANRIINAQDLETFTKEHPILANAASVALNLGSSVETAANLISYAASGGGNERMHGSKLGRLSSQIRGTTADMINLNIAGWDVADFVYQTTMSGIDSYLAGAMLGNIGAVSVNVGKGKQAWDVVNAAGIALGLSAAGQAANEAIDRGITGEDVFWTALVSGVNECLWESVSISQIKAMNEVPVQTIKDYAMNLVKSMATNFTEEAATEVANIVADAFINGDMSNFEQNVQAYMAQGLSEDEANKRALKDSVLQVLEAGGSGALMGAGFAGISSAQSYAANGRQSGSNAPSVSQKYTAGKNIIAAEDGAVLQALIDAGKTFDEKSAAYKLAEQLERSDGGLHSPINAANLTMAVSEQMNGQIADEIERELNNRGYAQGDTTRALAEEMARTVVAQNLIDSAGKTGAIEAPVSDFVRARIEADEAAANVFNEVVKNRDSVPNQKAATVANAVAAVDRAFSPAAQSESAAQDDTVQTQAGQNAEIAEAAPDLTQQAKPAENGQILREDGDAVDGTIYKLAYETAEDQTRAKLGVDKNSGQSIIREQGGETYGSQNTQILGRTEGTVRRTDGSGNVLRQQGENTRKIQAWLGNGSATGGAYAEARAGSDGWLGGDQKEGTDSVRYVENSLGDISGRRLNDTDSVGRRLSQDVKNKLARTVFKTTDGTLFSLFHWTDADFEKFDVGDLGFHFGTLDAAVKRQRQKTGSQSSTGTLKEVYLNITNPAVIDFDPMTWNAFTASYKLLEKGVINERELEQLSRLDGYSGRSYDSEASRELRRLLKEKGYDGILYTNAFEGGISAIAFDSDQIITVAENGRNLNARADAQTSSDKQTTNSRPAGMNYSTARERETVKKVAERLGRKVVFEDVQKTQGVRANGYIDKNNVIHIDYYNLDPVSFVLKHELTHFGEGTKAYREFKDAVMKSKLFNEWLKEKTGLEDAGLAEMKAKYRSTVMETRKNSVPVGVAQADAEMIADFVGERLFEDNGSGLEAMVSDIEVKQRPKVIQYLLDFVSYLKKKLSGAKGLTLDLSRLEDGFNRMLSEATKENTAENDGVRYALKNVPDNRTIEDNFSEIAKMKSVSDLSGEEFAKGSEDLVTQVTKFFDGIGNKVETPYGTIELNRTGVKASIAHGIGRNKAVAFTAVPKVLKQGKIIDYQKNWKNRGYDTATDSISNSSENVNNKFSVPTETSIQDEAARILDEYENGKISREEYLARMAETWVKAGEKHGTIEEGEKADYDHKVPKKVNDTQKVRRFIRTVLETGTLSSEAEAELGKEILIGNFSYDPVSDDSAMERADKYAKDGTALTRWNRAVNTGGIIGKDTIAVGERLLKDAMKSNDTKRIMELSAELSDILTRAGQTVQAARLLKKMTGAGRLMSVQRFINTLNVDYNTRYKKWDGHIQLDENIARQLIEAKSSEDIETAYQDALQNVADQSPSDWFDKWNAWRYFAMLANPRTHIRNIVGNAIFYPAVKAKDMIAAGIENAAVKTHLMDQSGRTKSARLKKEYLDFAKNDAGDKAVIEMLTGNGYDNNKSKVEREKRIFKHDVFEIPTRKNGNLLELEDTLFKNAHYKRALAEFLQARNIDLDNVDEKTLYQARRYAVLEAKKATFNDENKVSKAIKLFENSFAELDDKKKRLITPGYVAANALVEGVIPFKKTPVNIVRRGLEYSPIGLAKTLTKGLFDVKKGNITATEFIDGLASGLTGTGITAIGMLLSSLGWVTGGYDDDDEDEFKKLNGEQEYAIQIFGKSYSIDWAAPAVIPFFVGVEIISAARDTDSFSLADISDAMWASLAPITNLSMLEGVKRTIKATKGASDDQVIAAVVGDAVTSYFTQAIPSALGGLARTVDPTQREWYTDKNSWFDVFTQSVANNIMTKIPGLSYLMTPSVDEWGEEKKRGGFGERIAENFFSPGYYSEISYDDVEKELVRIHEATGESVYPKTADKSFAVNGATKYLTAKEYEAYAKARGRYSYKYISELMQAEQYTTLDDSEKAAVISNLYEFANAKAKTEVSDYEYPTTYSKAAEVDASGGSVVDFYLNKAIEKSSKAMPDTAYQPKDAVTAFSAGDDELAYDIIQDVVKARTEAFVKNGESKEEAEKSAKSTMQQALTTYFKPLYLEACDKGDTSGMKVIADKMEEAGVYDDLPDSLQRWLTETYKKPYIEACDKGDTAAMNGIVRKLDSAGVYSDTKKSRKTWLTAYYKPLYLDAYDRNDETAMRDIRFKMKAAGVYGTVDDIIDVCSGWAKKAKK